MKMKPKSIIILLAAVLLFNNKTIAVGTTYTWTGTNGTIWTDAGNWSPSTDYPGHTVATDIVIIANVTNAPILSSNLTNQITTLTINVNSILTITGSTTLIVTGKTTVNGELSPVASAEVSGNNITGSTLKTTGAGIIDVTAATGGADDFTTQYNGFKSYSLSQTTVNFTGASAQLISTATTFYNLEVSNTHGLSASVNVNATTITINAGATFTPGALNTVRGTISGSGSLQVTRITPGTGNPDNLTSQCTSVLTLANLTVEYVGTAVQTISTKDIFGNVQIDNPSGVSLGSKTYFNGTLNFTSGKLTLENDSLVMGTSGSISGANSSNYIVTNGKGVLEMTTSAGATTFPVGDSYNPITINDGTGGHVFYVSASNVVTDNSNNPVTDWAVGRTWHIVSSGGATVTVTPQWNETADLAGADFDNTDAFVSYRDSTSTYTWTPGAGTDISGLGNPYSLTSQSITFTAGDVYNIGVGGGSLSPLPVSLFNFDARYNNGHVNLNWTTASEQNNDYFNIERSIDATTWANIGKVAGHGTTNEMNSYTDIDKLAGIVPSGNIYYRLKQVDFNGAFIYSMIRSVAVSNPGISTIYPNPASNILNVNWTSHSEENSMIRLINMNGINIYQQSISGIGIMQSQIVVSTLPSGVYYLQIINGDGVVVNEKVVKN